MTASPDKPLLGINRVNCGPVEALARSLAIATISCSIVMLVFWWMSSELAFARNTRTEFAFHMPGLFWAVLAVAVVGTAAIIQTGSWVLATLCMLFVSGLLAPTLAWSGPGYMLDAVMPLVAVRMAAGHVLVLLCAALGFRFRAKPSPDRATRPGSAGFVP